MYDEQKKQKLIDFLDKHAFRPVLEASPATYQTQEDKNTLRDVQNVARAEQHRYHTIYGSAQEVRDSFHDDLESEQEQQLSKKLHQLGLPALEDVQSEFNKLCKQLEV